MAKRGSRGGYHASKDRDVLRELSRGYCGAEDHTLACLAKGGLKEFALLAGTPAGPEMVRVTLTAGTRRDPHSFGRLSHIPDALPDPVRFERAFRV